LGSLFVRLIVFIFLPTALVGYYYYQIATPMYGTKSEFLIQTSDSGGSSGGGLGGLLAGSGLASSQDSVTVQSYLTSREAMMRLDSEIGYKEAFSGETIDIIQRLPEGATNEKVYKVYEKNVKISYDPTEGIIKMEVIAPSPELSEAISDILITYAEERVDNLTQRLRKDQMQGAQEGYEKAERDMLAAEAEVLKLQEEMGVFDAGTDAALIQSQIGAYEGEIQVKSLALDQLLDNARPNKARVDGLRGDIRRLESLISNLREKLTQTQGESGSLAAMSGRFRIAQTNLETRMLMLQQALQQMENARIEANKQTRFLEQGVHPVAPDEPTDPKKFQDTLLAFIIFAGIYLIASITSSILREQVSS
jgi:capsular polysaccharide transport system permease protein